MTITQLPVGNLRLGKYISDLVAENVQLRKASMHLTNCTCPEDEMSIIAEEWKKVEIAADMLAVKYNKEK